MNRRQDLSTESGVSLIMVLVALTVFGLLVPVLGQFGSVNGVSGYIVKGQRFDRFAADNGVQGAIAYAQAHRNAGRAHGPCPDLRSTLDVGPAAFKRVVNVTCRGFAASGIPEASADTPAYAVLALAGGQHSLDVDSAGRLETSGAWFANGDINQTSADIHRVTIDASNDLFGATGGCKESAGARIFAAPKRCGAGDTVADPDFGSALTTLAGQHADSPAVTSDACRSIQDGNGVVALEPGIHWNVDWLNKLTDGSCRRDVVVWFKPGAHYFDFDFYDDALRGARDSQWTIGDSGSNHVTIVGGASTGWTNEAGARSAVTRSNNAPTSGACDLALPGVELMLGSQSNIRVESPARVELCPIRTGTDGQHVAVSGPTTGTAGSPVTVAPSVPRTAVADGGGDEFTWPDSPPEPIAPITTTQCLPSRPCGDPGTNFTEGDLRGRRGNATITMQVSNQFAENARLDTLRLNISHRETENRDGGGEENGRDQIRRLWFEITGLGAPVICGNLEPSNDWSQDSVNCDVRNFNIPMPDPSVDLGVVFHIETNRNDHGSVTVDLDSVSLDGMQTPAVVRAQGCGCEALFVDNNGHGNDASAFIWGTVYLPSADVHEDFGGTSAFRLERGVVAQHLTLENVPTAAGFIPVSLPNGGIYSTRTMTFEAAVAGKTKLRARVQFPDPVKSPDGPPKILSWDTHP